MSVFGFINTILHQKIFIQKKCRTTRLINLSLLKPRSQKGLPILDNIQLYFSTDYIYMRVLCGCSGCVIDFKIHSGKSYLLVFLPTNLDCVRGLLGCKFKIFSHETPLVKVGLRMSTPLAGRNGSFSTVSSYLAFSFFLWYNTHNITATRQLRAPGRARMPVH